MTILSKIALAAVIAVASTGPASADVMLPAIIGLRAQRPESQPPKDPAAMALCAKITEKLASAGDTLDPRQASALRQSQANVCAQKSMRWILGEDEAEALAARNNARLCEQLQRRLKGDRPPADEVAANRLAASRDYFCAIAGN